MLALISPAKKQDFTPCSPEIPHTRASSAKETSLLLETMKDFDAEGLMALMKISPKLAELNVGRFQGFAEKVDLDNSKQAALAFQGDTYVGLDAASFTLDDWAFAGEHLAILSGLYGFLRPLDLIQPHRLEMGTRLATERGTNLYGFWGNGPTEEINAALSRSASPWVINLASQEYFKVVRPKSLQGKLITPIFKEDRGGGKLQVIGIKAKRARGMMARYIIRNRLTEPKSLHNFNEAGYRFQPHLSTDTDWVFVA
jgi:uncharacterized protein